MRTNEDSFFIFCYKKETDSVIGPKSRLHRAQHEKETMNNTDSKTLKKKKNIGMLYQYWRYFPVLRTENIPLGINVHEKSAMRDASDHFDWLKNKGFMTFTKNVILSLWEIYTHVN